VKTNWERLSWRDRESASIESTEAGATLFKLAARVRFGLDEEDVEDEGKLEVDAERVVEAVKEEEEREDAEEGAGRNFRSDSSAWFVSVLNPNGMQTKKSDYIYIYPQIYISWWHHNRSHQALPNTMIEPTMVTREYVKGRYCAHSVGSSEVSDFNTATTPATRILQN